MKLSVASFGKCNTLANDEKKAQILQAMAAEGSPASNFVDYFSTSDFALIPNSNAVHGYRIWAAQKGDVTILVWERGPEVQNWIAKVQCW